MDRTAQYLRKILTACDKGNAELGENSVAAKLIKKLVVLLKNELNS